MVSFVAHGGPNNLDLPLLALWLCYTPGGQTAMGQIRDPWTTLPHARLLQPLLAHTTRSLSLRLHMLPQAFPLSALYAKLPRYITG